MIYQFGEFTLDPVRETLSNNNGTVALRGTAFLVLKLLIEKAPAVVSKESILNEVWGHESLSESSIPQVIKDIRQALGDSAKSPQHIATRYGRGYKFVAPVEKRDASAAAEPTAARSSTLRARWRFGLLLLTGLLLSVILFTRQNPVTNEASDSGQSRWLIRAVEAGDGESLSSSFAEYLNFVIGTAAGSNRVSVAKGDEPIDADSNIINVSLAIDDSNPDTRFIYSIAQAQKERMDRPLTGTRTNQPVQDSIDKILATIELSENTSIASGIVSQSPFATETLLRGMAAQFAGELDRAAALFEACLAEDQEFDFARYELAITLRRQGQSERGLALLQTLESRQSSPFWLYRIHNAQGIILRELGRYQQAADSLQIALDNVDSAIPRAVIASNLGLLLRDQGNYARAAAVLESSIIGIDSQEYPRVIASSKNSLASVYMGTGRLNEALSALESSSELFYQAGDRSGYANVLSRTAQVYQRLGQYTQAEHYLSISNDVRQQLGDIAGVALGKVRLSHLVRFSGDFSQARDLANAALALALESGSLSSQQTANVSLAETAMAADDYDNAIVYARRALELATQLAKPEAMLETRLKLFEIELAQNPDPAELPDQIQAAVDAAGEDINQHLQLQVDALIARINLMLGNATLGRKQLQAMRSEAQSSNEVELEIAALLALVRSHLPNDPQAARQYLDEAELLSPPAYPYLILRAKNLQSLGRSTDAMATALEARQKAGDWWRDQDEAFLNSL